MRKQISMLLMATIALFAVSCESSSDDTTTETTEGYVGTLSVDSEVIENYTGGLIVGYDFDMEDINASYTIANDLISIELFGVKFAEMMPVTLDITMPNIPIEDGEFSIDSVVPTVAGVPMADYTMTDVSGSINNLQLSILFNCLGQSVDYLGNANITTSNFSLEDVNFVPTVDGDIIEIEMYGVKFAEAMPVSLDITISGITISDSGQFSAATVIPTLNGVEMAAYTMTNVSGNLTDSEFNVNFECLGTSVTYEGTK